MAIARKWVGAVTRGTGVTLTPVAGGAIAAGDALIYFTWEYRGAQTIAAPGSFQAIDANTNSLQFRMFGLIASGGDTIPSVTWGTGSIAGTFVAAYTGVDQLLTAGALPADRNFSVTQNIVGPAASRTPSMDGCLLLFGGQRNKLSASDSTVYSTPSGWTGSSILQTDVRPGTNYSMAVSEWIQSTATATAANVFMPGTVADGSAGSGDGSLIILLPAATVAPNALLGWPKQTFVNTPIIQF